MSADWRTRHPLTEMGVLFGLLAIGYAAWSFGIGDWVIAEQCGGRPSGRDIDALIAYLDCRTATETRAISVGAALGGLLGGWLIRGWLRREAARERKRDAELDAEMERIRSRLGN